MKYLASTSATSALVDAPSRHARQLTIHNEINTRDGATDRILAPAGTPAALQELREPVPIRAATEDVGYKASAPYLLGGLALTFIALIKLSEILAEALKTVSIVLRSPCVVLSTTLLGAGVMCVFYKPVRHMVIHFGEDVFDLAVRSVRTTLLENGRLTELPAAESREETRRLLNKRLEPDLLEMRLQRARQFGERLRLEQKRGGVPAQTRVLDMSGLSKWAGSELTILRSSYLRRTLRRTV